MALKLPLRVLGDRVLIRPTKNPDTTASGLILPENRSDKYEDMQGTVVAVGTPRHPRKEDAAYIVSRLQAYVEIMQGAEHVDAAITLLRDLTRREPCVRPGDDVLFSWNVGQKVTIDDEEFLIMRESDLLAVLESE